MLAADVRYDYFANFVHYYNQVFMLNFLLFTTEMTLVTLIIASDSSFNVELLISLSIEIALIDINLFYESVV